MVGPMSRSDVVRAIGLTRSSVGGLVGDLTQHGFVREERAESDGSPGRPSPVVVPESEMNTVLAVEVLVDTVSVALIGLGGEVLDVSRRRRAVGDPSPQRTVGSVADMAAKMIARLDRRARLFQVGCAVTGLVRHDDNRVILAPNLGWADVPFSEMLAERLDLAVPVLVRNDGDMGALAEVRRGVAKGLDNVVYVSGEVGIGGGVVIDGQLMTGRVGFGGEIGHTIVNPDGRSCLCGAIGCWETEIGEDALIRRLVGVEVVDHVDRSAVLESARADAAAGDAAMLAAYAAHGRWVGLGLASLINVFNPDAIVLGGFLAPGFPFMSAAINAELDRRALATVREGTVVRASGLEAGAPLLGAGELAWDGVLADPVAAVEQRRTA